MKLRGIFCAIAIIGSLTATGPGASAQASGGTCTVSGGVTLSEPLSLTPTIGEFAFVANTTLTCVGVIDGEAVAGGGEVTAPGEYGEGELAEVFGPGDTCAYGSGKGSFSANVPMVGGGELLVVGQFDFVRFGSMVLLEGSANNSPLAGAFQFTPDLGQDCALTPVTSANVTGQAVVAG